MSISPIHGASLAPIHPLAPSNGEPLDSSEIDALTELKNGQWLRNNLPDMVEQDGGQLGLVFLDANDLSEVNNTSGHEAGNALLANIAKITQQTVRTQEGSLINPRPTDVIRYAGDEFVVVLRGVDTQDAVDVATERIQSSLGTANLSVSTGGVLYVAGESIEDFLKRASHAMQKAKELSKLDKYSSESQRLAAKTIGRIAFLNDINLRDLPTLLRALERTN